MKINRKGVLYSSLSLGFLMLVFASLFWTQIWQLYHTIQLFDEDVIVANFSDMKSIAPTILSPLSAQAK